MNKSDELTAIETEIKMRSHCTKVPREFLFSTDSEGKLRSNFFLKFEGLEGDVIKGEVIPRNTDFKTLYDSSSRYFHVQKLTGYQGYNIVRAIK
ncbi:MAG TPA: hypothetical protein VK783_11120 [Bacteroidia bacterium]|jgi:hypothetical protein|nr:hypothetical protein [Bacteroidia bacterium]